MSQPKAFGTGTAQRSYFRVLCKYTFERDNPWEALDREETKTYVLGTHRGGQNLT